MKNQIVIHGHFYQPPREDPWTGLVPHQESAYPYHDWNHRITNECYATNTKSRVLDPLGLVTDILNNFCYLSFNFGPTLLNWLKANNKDVYAAIIEADKMSMGLHNGHGNAIAQAYNHTILPLCTKEDALLQIRWGLADFEAHFGRKSEGIWLPETAVNNKVVDLLIETGVKYIILSPWQADSFCPEGTSHWQPLNNNPIPTGRAYKIERPGGQIAVFFYNHVLAHGISFEHYLTNADKLYERFHSFRQSNDKSYLINVATDGEVYGHHEPFGDMCIAAFSKLVKSKQDFEFTNYAHYLEQFPPIFQAKLKDGEGKLGTSWSCVHGVSRWYKNCGCRTGGQNDWNQEWRSPLRNAFNFLHEKLGQVYSQQMQTLASTDPLLIREAYITVLTGKVSRDDFAHKYIDRVEPREVKNLNEFYSLLEGQKFCQFMFTSCGWFFSEISGLEASQNLKYSVKAIDLYARYEIREVLNGFMEILETARSNISSFGSGRNILESWILPTTKNLDYGAAIFALKALCNCEEYAKVYGIFQEVEMIVDEQNSHKDNTDARGKIKITDYTTFSSATFDYSFVKKGMNGISLNMKNSLLPDAKVLETRITDLPIELRKQITDQISTNIVDECISDIPRAFEITQTALEKIKDINIQANETILKLAELLIDRIFEQLFNNPRIAPEEKELLYVKELILFTQHNRLKVDIPYLKEKISNLIHHQVELLTENVPEAPSRGIIHLLDVCRSVELEPEITHAQDIVFSLLKENDKNGLKNIEANKDFKGLNRIRRLIKLGSQLGINVDVYKEKFFDI